jgi:hypothetical protein
MSDLFEDGAGAVFSPCRTYRYRLRRGARPRMGVCMLNGSTADESTNDRTIVRVLSFATREGFEGIDVVNAFGLAATDSAELHAHPDPVGPENDAHLDAFAREHASILVGWGQLSKFPDRARAAFVVQLLTRHGATLWCLARNRDGTPKHPLFVAGDAPRLPFP